MTNIKIAVIGAGPAGITAALELRKLNLLDVTVFGNFEEAQCRTLYVDGVVADVGTCYVHNGYWNTVKPLVKRYGMRLNYLPDATLADDALQKPVIAGMQKIRTLLGLVLYLVLAFRYLAVYRSARSRKFRTLLGLVLYLVLAFRYLAVYRSARSRKYGISMRAYMERKGLGFFSKSFIFGPGGIAQGYGFLDDITAYGGLRWFRPSIFVTPFANKLRQGTATICEGYGALFSKVLSELNHHPQKITSLQTINAGDANHVQIELTMESGQRMLFDHVVIACRPDQFNCPASELLAPGSIKHTRFFSFLWTSPTEPWFADRVYLMNAIQREDRNKILTYRSYGKTSQNDYVYWGAGYANDDTPESELKSILSIQVEKDLRSSIRDVRFFQCFQYNLRFSAEAIREGLHLKIDRLQGRGHIWYSGGLLSHWDVDSIMEFNRLLAARMAYRIAPRSVRQKARLLWRVFRARVREV